MRRIKSLISINSYLKFINNKTMQTSVSHSNPFFLNILKTGYVDIFASSGE